MPPVCIPFCIQRFNPYGIVYDVCVSVILGNCPIHLSISQLTLMSDSALMFD